MLVGDRTVYYSCGMHHFGLPECTVPRTIEVGAAAELMSRFSAWLIHERPALAEGEVLSFGAGQSAFRLLRLPDERHPADDLFHNPHGIWQLEAADAAEAEVPNRWEKPEGEPLFIAVARDDEAMARAHERARTTFPEFLAAIKSPRFASSTNAVKLMLRDEAASAEMGEDRFVYLWLWDVRADSAGLCARVLELPGEGINDLEEGADVRFSPDEIRDWMINMDSQAWGAFTLRAIRAGMSPRERLQHDSYTGILAYRDPPF